MCQPFQCIVYVWLYYAIACLHSIWIPVLPIMIVQAHDSQHFTYIRIASMAIVWPCKSNSTYSSLTDDIDMFTILLIYSFACGGPLQSLVGICLVCLTSWHTYCTIPSRVQLLSLYHHHIRITVHTLTKCTQSWAISRWFCTCYWSFHTTSYQEASSSDQRSGGIKWNMPCTTEIQRKQRKRYPNSRVYWISM